MSEAPRTEGDKTSFKCVTTCLQRNDLSKQILSKETTPKPSYCGCHISGHKLMLLRNLLKINYNITFLKLEHICKHSCIAQGKKKKGNRRGKKNRLMVYLFLLSVLVTENIN